MPTLGPVDEYGYVYGRSAQPASPARYAFRAGSAPSKKGVIGTPIHAGYLTDIDDNTEVRGSNWYGTPLAEGIAARMLKDTHVKRSLEFISDPLIHADWSFAPVSSDAVDQEIAAAATWAWIDRLPWDQLLRAIITSYGAYGFALREYTDAAVPWPSQFTQHPGGGTGIAPTGLHERPAWTIERWYMSPSNPAQLESVEQWISGNDEEEAGHVVVPASRLLRWTYDQEGSDYTGRAVLRAAYGPWKLKNAFQAFDAIRHDRLSVGTPVVVGSETANDKDLEAVETILAYMRANEQGYLVLPNGYDFDWKGASSSDNGTNLNEAIERCNKDIAWNVSAGFMALSLMGKTGSHALGDIQQGQYHIYTEAHAKFFASVINKGSDGWSPIERFVRLNYGERAAIPKLNAKNLPTRPWLEIADRIVNLVQAGAVTSDDRLEADIRAGLRLPPADPTTARGLPQATGGNANGDRMDAPDDE